MATEIVAGPLGALRRAHGTAAGDALSTTAIAIALPPGTQRVFITPRNFSAANVVAQIALTPWLHVVKTTDDLATATDYSDNAQDGSASTDVTLSSLGTAAQGDYLYVGSHLPFRGAYADVDAANGDASVLTVKYRKTDDTWAAVSGQTDGTDNAGATFGQDGAVTWTVPSDWKKTSLAVIASPAPAAGVIHRSADLYWTRWEVSAALDASTTLNSLLALAQSTNYSEWLSGQAIEFRVARGPNGIGAVEAATSSGTGNLLVNVAVPTADKGFI